jgi:hypothetical protein
MLKSDDSQVKFNLLYADGLADVPTIYSVAKKGSLYEEAQKC